MTPSRHRLASAALLLVLALGATACGDDDGRPAAADWEPTWVAAQAELPEPAELDDGADVCDEALGALRASREELLPGPSRAVDERVGEWVARAEGLMLDCPGGRERSEGFDDLRVLAAEIDAALAIAAEGGSG